jgi:uncharacterized protein YkuJ
MMDIDIDFADRTQILQLIKHVSAMQTVDGHVRRHNSGIYVTDIPYDPVNDCASIDYQEAEQRGYFKIDLLNMNVYSLIQSPEHYEQMLASAVPWHRLHESEFCEKIVHIGAHYHTLIKMPNPVDSIVRMAAFISIIRPGKSHLIGKSWNEIFSQVWDGDTSRGYTFKKSHAMGYAQLVALHMNLIHSSNQGN